MKIDDYLKKNCMKKLKTLLKNGFDFSATVISFAGNENGSRVRDDLATYLGELLGELGIPVVLVEYRLEPNWILYKYYNELPHQIPKEDEQQFYLLREFALSCDVVSFYTKSVKPKIDEGYCVIWKNSPIYYQMCAMELGVDMEWITNVYNIIPNSDISFIINSLKDDSKNSKIIDFSKHLKKLSSYKAYDNVHFLNGNIDEPLFVDVIEAISKMKED